MTRQHLSSEGTVAIGLNAVLAVVENEKPKVLCVRGEGDLPSLPYGQFDPARHRTFEIGIREWVERQTQVRLGYVEQLYTFGDEGREAPAALLASTKDSDRIISVGYLALAAKPAAVNAKNAGWRDWYEFFPWEDWRNSEPDLLEKTIIPAIFRWISEPADDKDQQERLARARLAFGLDDLGWEEERALDRYELMYEAGLVMEAMRDRKKAGAEISTDCRNIARLTGVGMASDHRRILATAIGRLRGKLKYRPIIFQLSPPKFTLLSLQRTVEAIVGFELHKQNFRRSVEQGGLAEKTVETVQQPSGRPAALFKASQAVRRDRAAKGLTIPRLRRSPTAP